MSRTFQAHLHHEHHAREDTLKNKNSAVLIILYFTASLKMPLKEWSYFNKGVKNNVHFWAQRKATAATQRLLGQRIGWSQIYRYATILRRRFTTEYQNTKCKLTQQTFHVVNSSSAPMSKTEYDEFQWQNLLLLKMQT